jgi:hypothetical protein
MERLAADVGRSGRGVLTAASADFPTPSFGDAMPTIWAGGRLVVIPAGYPATPAVLTRMRHYIAIPKKNRVVGWFIMPAPTLEQQ